MEGGNENNENEIENDRNEEEVIIEFQSPPSDYLSHGNDVLIESHPLETVIKKENVELNIKENEKVKKNSIPELVGKEEVEESKSSSLLEKEIPSRKVSKGREFLNIQNEAKKERKS